MRLRARQAGDGEGVADRDALDRLDRADRHRQAPVEALLPGDVRAETGNQPERLHLEDAAERLVGPAQLVDLAHHRLRSPPRPGSARASCRPRRSPPAASGRSLTGACTEAIWMTCECTATPSARRNTLHSAPPATRAAVSRAEARSRMLRTSDCLYFCVPTRSAWPGRGRWTSARLLGHRPGAHALLPVGVVAVRHLQRDRAAERATVADAAGDLGGVALDLHPPAAAVAELAAGHVVVEILGAHAEARGQALDDAGQAGAVRLAGRYETERHAPSLFAGDSWSVRRGSGGDPAAMLAAPGRTSTPCAAVYEPPRQAHQMARAGAVPGRSSTRGGAASRRGRRRPWSM